MLERRLQLRHAIARLLWGRLAMEELERVFTCQNLYVLSSGWNVVDAWGGTSGKCGVSSVSQIHEENNINSISDFRFNRDPIRVKSPNGDSQLQKVTRFPSGKYELGLAPRSDPSYQMTHHNAEKRGNPSHHPKRPKAF